MAMCVCVSLCKDQSKPESSTPPIFIADLVDACHFFNSPRGARVAVLPG